MPYASVVLGEEVGVSSAEEGAGRLAKLSGTQLSRVAGLLPGKFKGAVGLRSCVQDGGSRSSAVVHRPRGASLRR